MKKLKVILSIIFAILLSGCSKSYIIDTSINNIEKMVNNKESFVLYIGSKDCHNCTNFTPKIEDVANEYEIKIYYIDTYDISDEDYNRLFKIVNYNGTPTLAFITDGEDPGTQTHLVGNVSIDKIKSAFKNNGYIK